VNEPTNWGLFQDTLVGITAGVISSTAPNKGAQYVFLFSALVFLLAIITVRVPRKVFEWADRVEDNDEDRPYEDVNFAS
jgi:hypothetical protein